MQQSPEVIFMQVAIIFFFGGGVLSDINKKNLIILNPMLICLCIG